MAHASSGNLARWITRRSHAMPALSTFAHIAGVSLMDRCSSFSSGGFCGRPRFFPMAALCHIKRHSKNACFRGGCE